MSIVQDEVMATYDVRGRARLDASTHYHLGHVVDNVVPEFRAFNFGCPFHQAREVVGDPFARNGFVQSFNHEIRGFPPTKVPQHHFSRKHHGTWVDLIEIRILGRGTVGRFENCVPGVVINIAAGCDADAADLRGQSVGKIIAIQIQRRDHIEIFGAGQNLLQGDVCDRVFDEDLALGQRRLHFIVGTFFAFLLLGPFPFRPGIGLIGQKECRPDRIPNLGSLLR